MSDGDALEGLVPTERFFACMREDRRVPDMARVLRFGAEKEEIREKRKEETDRSIGEEKNDNQSMCKQP